MQYGWCVGHAVYFLADTLAEVQESVEFALAKQRVRMQDPYPPASNLARRMIEHYNSGKMVTVTDYEW